MKLIRLKRLLHSGIINNSLDIIKISIDWIGKNKSRRKHDTIKTLKHSIEILKENQLATL